MTHTDADLCKVVERWGSLTPQARAAIMALLGVYTAV